MISNCSDDLVHTYEALKLVSLHQFCTDKVIEQSAKLQKCNGNTTCVNELMCNKVRQDYCTAEWRVLELNKSEDLIDCGRHGETNSLECNDQFGLTNNGSICLPLCKEFSQFSETFTAIFPIFLSVCYGINVIGGIIVLIIFVYKIKKL